MTTSDCAILSPKAVSSIQNFYMTVFQMNWSRMIMTHIFPHNPRLKWLSPTAIQAGQNKSGDRQRLLDICRASSSLPYVSKVIDVDGLPYLDGGIVDSIPVQRAIDMGHERNVLVLTRNRGYRNTSRDRKIPRFIYKKYPRLRVVLSRRIAEYNRQREMVEDMEDRGIVDVIRPQRPMDVGRMEKDEKKLEALYEEGFVLGEQFCQSKVS